MLVCLSGLVEMTQWHGGNSNRRFESHTRDKLGTLPHSSHSIFLFTFQRSVLDSWIGVSSPENQILKFFYCWLQGETSSNDTNVL